MDVDMTATHADNSKQLQVEVTAEVDETQSDMEPCVVHQESDDVCYVTHFCSVL